MKINWGTGLAIGLGLFVVFILYFVIRISTEDQFSYDLVTEQYFEKELVFQEEIDAAENYQSFGSKISSKKSDKGYEIIFPEGIKVNEVEGLVIMYRPSNKKLDFEAPLKLTNSTFLISNEDLPSGRWDVKVLWNYKGKSYLYKEKLNY